MSNKKRGSFSKTKLQAIIRDPIYSSVYYFAKDEVKPLLKEIKKRKKSDKIRSVFFNYLIIRAVTILEVFLANEAYQLAKENREQARELFSDLKVGIPVADQVVSTHSFMSLDDIDLVFSKLLKNDFFDEVKKEAKLHSEYFSIEPVHIEHSKLLHRNWNSIFKIFDYRHSIVHRGKTLKGNYADIRDLVGGIIQFMLIVTLMIHTEEKETYK